MTEVRATPGGTGSADYSAAYYFDGHLGPPYTYEEPHWRIFFGGVADALVATFEPTTTYDAGCAIGLFVRALLERGVDAYGGDISEFAVMGAPEGLRERLEVRDLTQPFDRRFDLISCIEVLEHMSSEDAHAAIANMCAATDTVLLSSTPEDFTEPTHINVRTPAAWAQDFASHGFFRRTDIDASFLSPWAVVFSRQKQTVVETVSRYETLLAPLSREVIAKRQALLEVQRDLDRARGVTDEERGRLNADLERANRERDDARAGERRAVEDRDRLLDELTSLRRGGGPDEQLVRLAMVDEVIGLKAELVQARMRADNAVVDASDEVERLRGELEDVRDELSAVKASVTWRVGRGALTPVRVARRLRRPR
jgi:SAM-dependent methyltransferase